MRIAILYNLVEETHYDPGIGILPDSEITDPVESIIEALKEEHEVVPILVNRKALRSLSREDFDIVFNLCEGLGDNNHGEAWVAGYLDILGMPYTGSNSFTLGLCMNKIKTKHILIANNIPTPKYQKFISPIQRVNDDLRFPLIIKPALEDGSLGITVDSVVKDPKELADKVEYLLANFHQPILVEEFIDGREINVSVIGNDDSIEVLPVSEILFDFPDDIPNIVSYKAKWHEGSFAYRRTTGACPADLTPEVEALVKSTARNAYVLMGCRDYARIDIRLIGDKPYVLEINPNPWIDVDGGLVRSAAAAGLTYRQLIVRILKEAMKRCHMSGPVVERSREEYATRNLIVHRVQFEHLDIVTRWYNEMQAIHSPDCGEEQTYTRESMIEKFFISKRDDIDLLIADRRSGQRIGMVSLEKIDANNRSAELFLLIGERSFLGKGHAQEAVRLMLDIACRKMGLKNITALVVAGNEHSRKVFQDVGFRRVGVLHQYFQINGSGYDVILYEMIVDDVIHGTSLEQGRSVTQV
ncbi:MAG: GNAT family N-acetyltransferase [Candidatus Thermoplasmatota archaeon]|nr:GNAT family N-acetyltransferase [Candidatus Thermoplasmatota archaeon]